MSVSPRLDHSEGTPGANLVPLAPEERRELERLQVIQDEYHVTLQVLAVVTERLRNATGEPLVLIRDDELAESPDLIARRDDPRHRIELSTSR